MVLNIVLIALVLLGSYYLYTQRQQAGATPLFGLGPQPSSNVSTSPVPQAPVSSTQPGPLVSVLPSSPLPTAAQVQSSESFIAPPIVKGFIIYLPNEAHEPRFQQMMHDKNAHWLPNNVTVHNGASIAVVSADAAHTHPITVGTKKATLQYTGGAVLGSFLPGTHRYTSTDISRPGTLTVLPTPVTGNLTVGALYMQTKAMPALRTAMQSAGFSILSEYNYTWRIEKQTDTNHTVVVYSTSQDIQAAVQKLRPIIRMQSYT